MKKAYVLFVAGSVLLACTPKSEVTEDAKASTPVEQVSSQEDDQQESPTGKFGAEISADGAIASTEVGSITLGEKTKTLKVKGEINEVCQMKGCWMTMDIGNGESMRVTFKDYGFFVPKNASGHQAIIEGELKEELVDVETLKHYAEDAGKSEEEIAAITEPEEKLTFEAVGVIIM